MPDTKDPDALTDDGRAPVLSEDQAEAPIEADHGEQPKDSDRPIEENDFNAQPG